MKLALKRPRWYDRVAVVLALAIVAVVTIGTARGREVDVQLVLAVDVSASMSQEALALQREAYMSAFSDPEVLDAIRSGPAGAIAVTIFEWSAPGQQEVLVPWTLVDGPETARQWADALRPAAIRPLSSTALGEALTFATGLLQASPFQGGRRVIDISGDGPTNAGEPAGPARDRANALGIVVNGLLLRNPNEPGAEEHYTSEVIGGPGSFLVVAEGAIDFSRALRRKLILEIAGLTRVVVSR